MDSKELVTGVVRLVSLPEVCLRVTEMLEDPGTTATDLGHVISRDTGLTARLLKIVNSAYYGFSARIETVTRAVTIIGLRELRGLVLAASAIEAFSKIPSDLLNMAYFWRHSVYCGVIAQLLAKRCNVLHSERLFVAGLLHDIGKLIICHKLTDKAELVIKTCQETGECDFIVEQRILGFDHAEVGSELLREWRMPDSLRDSVAFHHNPELAEDTILDVCMIHIANCLTGMAEQEIEQQGGIQEISDYAWKISGLDESIIEDIFSEAGPLFSDALETILPKNYLP
ncbi:Predicted signal transduction protein [hydrothermal vent metagenome]|uniref:Predicted signal transduction protein n=1 Tax=hydrothermal vent metagenome TaxID=652676 RepID=A0A3B1AAZ2_9ZZZZ